MPTQDRTPDTQAAERPPPALLTCSAKRSQYGWDCRTAATWAVKAKTGTHWHGACYHHPHQVLKNLGGAQGVELEVRLATDVVEELRRIWEEAQGTDPVEELVECARPLVQDDQEGWTDVRLAGILSEESGSTCTPDQAAAVLHALVREKVLEHQGGGRYLSIASLPR